MNTHTSLNSIEDRIVRCPVSLYEVDQQTGEVRFLSQFSSLSFLHEGGSLIRFMHPEDRGKLHAIREELASGRMSRGELDVRLAPEDQPWQWFHLREAIADENHFAGALFEIDDPTSAQRLQVDAEQILIRSGAVMMRWGPGPDWPILFASRNVDQFGYRAHELVRQQARYSDFIHPQDLAVIDLEARRAAAPHDLSATSEYRLRCQDGSFRWVEELTMIRRDASGHPVEYTGIIKDISDRKASEEALRASNARLTEAVEEARRNADLLQKHSDELARARDAAVAYVRAREELISNVSHELRTPLGGVLGTANLLLDSPLTEEQHDYAMMIRKSANSLLRVVDDILDFTQLRASKVERRIHPVDLLDLVGEIYDAQRPAALEKGLDLRLSLPTNPVTVLTDGVRLRQALVHLVDNAIKYTESGWVEIKLQVEAFATGRVIASFSISDTGPGIEESGIAHIFESFTQGEGGANRRFGGIGLGLTICQYIAEMLGGSIGVESKPSEGSRFWLEFPFDVAASVSLDSSRRGELPTMNDRMIALDASRLAEVCGDDPEFLSAVLSEYVADGAKNLRALRDALELTDVDKALTILHRLKGSSRTVGAIEVAENAASIEAAVHANGLSALELEIDRLEQVWERLESAATLSMNREAA
ncbi:MAG: PAS domain-containing protein [Fimbriimonadaceae bacterium]|nr:PAS domain-containing protein [Fimbriimonadaceae bacterium]